MESRLQYYIEISSGLRTDDINDNPVTHKLETIFRRVDKEFYDFIKLKLLEYKYEKEW